VEFEVWDVFAARALEGNALAVVPDAGALDAATMQAVAREFALSETVFVRPGGAGRPRLRIFTPARELPIAGHPTIGATFALDRRGRLATGSATFELGVGPVEVGLERDAHGRLTRAWMDQGRPRRLATDVDRPAAAHALHVDEAGLAEGLPVEVWSVGNPFLLVPLASEEALARASLTLARLGGLAPEEHRAVLAFVPPRGGRPARCRMFGEALGVVEDPGTGSAHGPLGAYLARHGLVAPPRGERSIDVASLQGVEMGRPSHLTVRLRALPEDAATEAALSDVRVAVGGAAIRVMTGHLDLLAGEGATAGEAVEP
jgi:trans-2,3-dihydro-3-hydroxyanthranilate isomerase